MLTEEEQRVMGNRISEIVKELDKIRWDLITMSLALIPVFKPEKKEIKK